jgi:hypothetical protein
MKWLLFLRLWLKYPCLRKGRTEIHEWFGLTYSSYLVLPRSVLQNTPVKWQRKFVALLEELEDMASNLNDLPGTYTVQCRDEKGRFTHDPYCDYDRGRREVQLKLKI